MTDTDHAADERDAFEHDPYARGPYEIEADGVRRLVLDSEHEEALQASNADGRQSVVQPPVGTVGGPMKPPGDDVTTTDTRSIPTGGGPGDPRRMPDDLGDRSATGRLHTSTDSGVGASPDPK